MGSAVVDSEEVVDSAAAMREVVDLEAVETEDSVVAA